MTADRPTPAGGIPNMDAPFDLGAARDAARRYEGMTDAEYIDDQAAFNKAYTFAAHSSARHLHAALAELARRDAALADLTRQRDEARAELVVVYDLLAAERIQHNETRVQLERQAPVVEAARALAGSLVGAPAVYPERIADLIATVSALGPVDPEVTND